MTAMPRLCFIGFGEAGQAMAASLREEGVERIAAWDILFPDPAGSGLRQAAEAIGVRVASSPASALGEAEVVISAVTAASSFDAARDAAPHLPHGAFFLDVNSVSPGRKQESAKLFGDAARYVDVAILAPIHPRRHRSPMLLAGPHAQEFASFAATLGMQTSIAGLKVGEAAAIKMIRSVIIKGIEALTLECFLAAARAGVVEAVADSLKNNYPTLDWNRMIEYNIERMATHGTRRAAEMDEVVETLRELSVDPLMAQATAKRQREMGRIGRKPAVRAATTQGGAEILHAVSEAKDES